MEDLQAVYGIGPVLVARILSSSQELNGLLFRDQLQDIWGIDTPTSVSYTHLTLPTT